jgi:nucleoredoxin
MRIRAAFLLTVALVTLSLDAAEAPRVWKSKDGTATITATFQKFQDGNLTVILANGRSQVIAQEFLSDEDLQWLREKTSTNQSQPSVPTTSSAQDKIPAALAGKLIDKRGKPFDLAAEGPLPRYYLFYYSASWCGPCHAFTPELVKFHRKMKARKADFEVILYPNDRNLEDEIAYMKEMRMPWPGLSFDHRNAQGLPANSYGYIPAMVLVDASGKQLLAVSKEVSRDAFLAETEKILGAQR